MDRRNCFGCPSSFKFMRHYFATKPRWRLVGLVDEPTLHQYKNILLETATNADHTILDTGNTAESFSLINSDST